MKCTRSFIPHSHSGMDRTPFHPFCSQEQNERNVANENQRWRTAGRVLSIQTLSYQTYRRKKSGYTFGQNETLLLISLYQKYEAYFSDVSYNKKAIWQMIADDMKKSGYSPSATNCENRWKCLTSLFRKCEDNNNKSGRSRHICYAMFTPARFVHAMFTHARTTHPDGRFFMQAIRIIPSILFQPFLFQNSG